MTKEQRRRAGVLLKQFRTSIWTLDGKPLTQEELAQESGVSVKTIERMERGDQVSNQSIILVLEALQRLGLDSEKLSMLEDAFNPVRIDKSPHLNDKERWNIKEELRKQMLKIPSPVPGFVMDEYWFVRTINVYMLALHGIRLYMLGWPETWHVIAMKFRPELEMRGKRGPEWEDYYLATVKDFRRKLAVFKGTERYEKVIQWLHGLENFTTFWNRAARVPELEYEVRVRTAGPIPVALGSKVQKWDERGGKAPVSPQLPDYWCSMWLPAGESSLREKTETLECLRLSEKAEELGYDVGKAFFFIEDCVREDSLRNLGGWIE